MTLKNEKSNFRFSFFKNEIPNGSETEVHTIIIINNNNNNNNNDNNCNNNNNNNK